MQQVSGSGVLVLACLRLPYLITFVLFKCPVAVLLCMAIIVHVPSQPFWEDELRKGRERESDEAFSSEKICFTFHIINLVVHSFFLFQVVHYQLWDSFRPLKFPTTDSRSLTLLIKPPRKRCYVTRRRKQCDSITSPRFQNDRDFSVFCG